jgi:hypothetical protein
VNEGCERNGRPSRPESALDDEVEYRGERVKRAVVVGATVRWRRNLKMSVLGYEIGSATLAPQGVRTLLRLLNINLPGGIIYYTKTRISKLVSRSFKIGNLMGTRQR